MTSQDKFPLSSYNIGWQVIRHKFAIYLLPTSFFRVEFLTIYFYPIRGYTHTQTVIYRANQQTWQISSCQVVTLARIPELTLSSTCSFSLPFFAFGLRAWPFSDWLSNQLVRCYYQLVYCLQVDRCRLETCMSPHLVTTPHGMILNQ